jgi:hypothetical protein
MLDDERLRQTVEAAVWNFERLSTHRTVDVGATWLSISSETLDAGEAVGVKARQRSRCCADFLADWTFHHVDHVFFPRTRRRRRLSTSLCR